MAYSGTRKRRQPTPVFENGCEQQVADASHAVGEVAFGQACQSDAADRSAKAACIEPKKSVQL